MMRSLTLVSLVLALCFCLTPTSALRKRSDQHHIDYPSAAGHSANSGLLNELFNFRRGYLSDLYNLFRDAGVPEGLAKVSVVLVFAGLAVLASLLVDYLLQSMGTLGEKRSLTELNSLTPETVREVLGAIERAAALWQ